MKRGVSSAGEVGSLGYVSMGMDDGDTTYLLEMPWM